MTEKTEIETIKMKHENFKTESTIPENATRSHLYKTKYWLGCEAVMSCIQWNQHHRKLQAGTKGKKKNLF